MDDLGHILMNMPIRIYMDGLAIVLELIAIGFFVAWWKRVR